MGEVHSSGAHFPSGTLEARFLVVAGVLVDLLRFWRDGVLNFLIVLCAKSLHRFSLCCKARCGVCTS